MGEKKWFRRNVDKKTKYILSSFNELTNFEERSGIAKSLVNNLIDYKEFSSVSSYFNNLIDYRYVICPAGNGLDTHRVWESLLLKIVPIHKINNFTLILKNNGVPGLYIENQRLTFTQENNLINTMLILTKKTLRNFQALTLA